MVAMGLLSCCPGVRMVRWGTPSCCPERRIVRLCTLMCCPGRRIVKLCTQSCCPARRIVMLYTHICCPARRIVHLPRLGPGHRADALEARLSMVPPFIGIAGFGVLLCWLLAGCAGRRAYARQVLRVAGTGSPLPTPHAPRGHRGAAAGPQCPPRRPPHRSRRFAPGRPSDAIARRRPVVRAVTAPIAIIALIIGAALVLSPIHI